MKCLVKSPFIVAIVLIALLSACSRGKQMRARMQYVAACSKGFDWLQATLRAFCGYQYSQSEQLIGGILYLYHSRTVSFGTGGTITPLPWLNLVLSSGFSWNKSQTDREHDDLCEQSARPPNG
ncbi:MAG: hypothetical protein IKI47_01640 [Prevotella sp.]|nr:hypothetical protein [Prevotella sp.]